MWALGICAFKLLYGRNPRDNSTDRALIQNDHLLAGLLTVNRNQRLNINQALDKFNEKAKHLSLQQDFQPTFC